MSEHLTTSLGAYALGALEPPDRAQVETHLRFCQDCRDQLASIAGLPGLLSHLQPTDLDLDLGLDLDIAADGSTGTPATGVGADLLQRTLRELAVRQRRQRTRTRMLSAAASLVLLAAGAGLTTALSAPTGPHQPTSTITAADRGSRATAVFTLHTQPWGTAVTVHLQHVPAGTHCRLLTIDRRGQQQTISSWQADYDGGASINAASDLSLTDIATLEITTTTGHTIISAATI